MKRIIWVTAVAALVLAVPAFAWVETYLGNSANNTWTGSSGADFADGFGGNDTLKGNGGNDEIWGSQGSDNLRGGTGKDKLYAGCQPGLSCVGGAGDDNILVGDDGDDTIGADNGHPDDVSGGTGYDVCYVDAIDRTGLYGCEKTVTNGVITRWDP